jgi:hypothetical protein
MGEIHHTNHGDDILYIPSYKSLPKSKVTQIENVIKKDNVIERGCWWNSLNVSMKVDGVDIVQGWYGGKINEESHKNVDECLSDETMRKQLKTGGWFNMGGKRLWMKFYEDRNFYVITNNRQLRNRYGVVDLNNRIEYLRHTWNIYNNVHFDVTKEFLPDDISFNRGWVNYKSVKTVDTSSLKDNELIQSGWKTNMRILQYSQRIKEVSIGV